MHFTTSTLLAGAALLATASADGIFGMNATAVPSSSVLLTVYNGNVGDAPTCNGTVAIGAFPASGNIPCAAGYSTSFTWNSVTEGIQATYATPSAAAFTYNVPQTSNDGTTYIFGFADYFPSAQAAAAFVAKPFTA